MLPYTPGKQKNRERAAIVVQESRLVFYWSTFTANPCPQSDPKAGAPI